MFSVFIAHHPDDFAAAADLACRLDSSGAVSRLGKTAEEAWNRGYSSDYVAIIWSANSLSSPYLYEIAAVETDYRLLHLKLGDVKIGDIPATVRPDKLISTVDHILIFKKLSSRQLQGMAYRPSFSLEDTPPQLNLPGLEAARNVTAKIESSKKARQSALATESGKLVHKIAENMKAGIEEVIEVRLGRVEANELIVGLMGAGPLIQEDVQIVETMTVELRSLRRAFVIVPHSRRTQLVNRKRFRADGYEDFGKWVWQVTPKKHGIQELHVAVSATLLDSRGVPASTSLPPRIFPVHVRVNYRQLSGHTLKLGVTGIAGAFFAGIVGAFTQDIWWPTLKGWMQALRLLT